MSEFKAVEGRKIKCTRCGKPETELVYGEGFPGWIILKEIAGVRIVEKMVMEGLTMKKVKQQEQIFPELCPDCLKEFLLWLENKAK